MKTILLIIFYSVTAFAQNVSISGHVKSSEDLTDFNGVNVYVVKDGKIKFGAITDEKGNYQIKDIPIGTYDIKLSFLGFMDKVISDFDIKSETKLVDIFYPDLCEKSNKNCPYNHTENIIPIVYGLPSKKMERQAKNGKIKLGGCFTLCPKWYCNKHKLEF